MAGTQICIHTPNGMICYQNSDDGEYGVSVYLLSDGRSHPMNRGEPFTTPLLPPLRTGQQKLMELFARADSLLHGGGGDQEKVERLELGSWHTVTRKVGVPA